VESYPVVAQFPGDEVEVIDHDLRVG